VKATSPKQVVLKSLEDRYGPLKKLGAGNSLFATGAGLRFYVRYSKLHRGHRGFFGLDRKIVQSLAKEDAYVLFGLPKDKVFVVPVKVLRDSFRAAKAAYDDSYKVQLVLDQGTAWLYVPKRRRVDVTQYLDRFPFSPMVNVPSEEPAEVFEARAGFTHEQIQQIVAKMGKLLGFEVWVPRRDRGKRVGDGETLGEGCIPHLELVAPRRTMETIENVDVIWLEKDSFRPVAFFEVEHSTSIYSGLLRLNDIIVDYPLPRAGIVSFEKRRPLFVKELTRRTFQKSGLDKVCRFYNYRTVHGLLNRLQSNQQEAKKIAQEFL
jgi:hypothetical protein